MKNSPLKTVLYEVSYVLNINDNSYNEINFYNIIKKLLRKKYINLLINKIILSVCKPQAFVAHRRLRSTNACYKYA